VLFMVVERFSPESAKDIYRRVRREGRLLPAGLRYVDSWVQADLRGCFQLMECDDVGPLQEWIASWGDLADFELVAVAPSRLTVDLMARLDSDEL
jgi:Protein of unknown function (DUF3303)